MKMNLSLFLNVSQPRSCSSRRPLARTLALTAASEKSLRVSAGINTEPNVEIAAGN